MKLKGRHLETIEMIEAESQAVLNRQHDIQDEFKNGRNSGNGAYARKGTSSKMMVVSMPEVSFFFYQMPAPVPEIMDGSLYLHF
jgi:hypothetical protein